MKILFVIPALGNVYGGPSKLLLEMAQALGSKGINVDIVTTNANGSTVLNVPLNTWVTEKCYRLRYFSYSPLFDYKVSISLTKWLFNHVQDYDLVHTIAIFSYPVLAAHFICQIQRVPYIMNPQGMLEPWALSYKAWKKGFYYSLFEKPALEKASAIQMLSSAEASKVEVLKLSTPKVIIPNGIHRQDFDNLPNPELFYQQFPRTRNKSLILFLGRIDPKKGLDLLATAFAKVKAEFPDAHLIVAGPDNIGFQPTAKSYFINSGCLDAVTFTGMLAGSIKYSALAAASVYVAPSYSEGFSISILEGMASGLPCIFTTSCNFPEAAAAEAAYVIDVDADKITSALTECLNNPEKSKEMGARARKLIFEQYTWEQIATNLTVVYNRIINKDKGKDSLSSLQSITS
jgi:glycosyltransferase involved in cell wall biosynthesis